jgi:succinoglycan biosynthesis transport protein ExoP
MSSTVEPIGPLTRVADSLRAHWALVVCVVALALVGAVAYVLLADERYRAQADLLVTPLPPGDETFTGIPMIREGNESRGVLTAARLVRSPQVAQDVVDQLDLDVRFDQLLAQVEAVPQEQSNVVTILAEAGSPTAAAQVANAVAEVIIARRTTEYQEDLQQIVQRLSDRLESIPSDQQGSAEAISISERLGILRALVGASDPTLSILSPAVPPREPSSPRPLLSLAVALTVGLILGIAGALARDSLTQEIRRERDLAAEDGLRVLGRIPPVRDARSYFAGEKAVPAELGDAYRTLRANLATAVRDWSTPRTVLVTSASDGEEKTSAAAHLALATAVGSTRTVLVDADLRRPNLGSLFGVEAGRDGLAALLAGSQSAARSLTPVAQHKSRLRLLLAGPEDGRLRDVDYAEVASLGEKLRRASDLVVFDSPPLTEAEDAAALASTVDAVVIAITIGSSRRDQLKELRASLERLGVPPTGFIVMHKPRLGTRLRALVSSWLEGRAADTRRDTASAKPHQAEGQASGVPGEQYERREAS